jgi:hypothetical protein
VPESELDPFVAELPLEQAAASSIPIMIPSFVVLVMRVPQLLLCSVAPRHDDTCRDETKSQGGVSAQTPAIGLPSQYQE